MKSSIQLTISPEFLAMLDRHRMQRPDRPTRSTIMRDYTVRGIEAWERSRDQAEAETRRKLARSQREARGIKTAAQERATAERRESARVERERLKSEREAALRWNSPAPGSDAPSP